MSSEGKDIPVGALTLCCTRCGKGVIALPISLRGEPLDFIATCPVCEASATVSGAVTMSDGPGTVASGAGEAVPCKEDDKMMRKKGRIAAGADGPATLRKSRSVIGQAEAGLWSLAQAEDGLLRKLRAKKTQCTSRRS